MGKAAWRARQFSHSIQDRGNAPPNGDDHELIRIQLDIQPLTPALGAEVFGIDLSKQLSQSELDAIRRALVAHQVIFFRDQQ